MEYPKLANGIRPESPRPWPARESAQILAIQGEFALRVSLVERSQRKSRVEEQPTSLDILIEWMGPERRAES